MKRSIVHCAENKISKKYFMATEVLIWTLDEPPYYISAKHFILRYRFNSRQMAFSHSNAH